MKLLFSIFFLFPIGVFAQNVGIGTNTTHSTALLHIELGASITNGVLVTGVVNGSSTLPNLGGGSSLMFYPGKSAFRAGSVVGTQAHFLFKY